MWVDFCMTETSNLALSGFPINQNLPMGFLVYNQTPALGNEMCTRAWVVHQTGSSAREHSLCSSCRASAGQENASTIGGGSCSVQGFARPSRWGSAILTIRDGQCASRPPYPLLRRFLIMQGFWTEHITCDSLQWRFRARQFLQLLVLT